MAEQESDAGSKPASVVEADVTDRPVDLQAATQGLKLALVERRVWMIESDYIPVEKTVREAAPAYPTYSGSPVLARS